MIVIGVLFCAFRSGMINILLTIVGVLIIALGVYDVVKKDYVRGIAEIVIGVLVIVFGWLLLEVALVIFGVAFIVLGGYQIYKKISEFKAAKGASKILVVLKPVLMIIFGILLIVAPWVAETIMDVLFIIAGIILIIDGILLIIKK